MYLKVLSSMTDIFQGIIGMRWNTFRVLIIKIVMNLYSDLL